MKGWKCAHPVVPFASGGQAARANFRGLYCAAAGGRSCACNANHESELRTGGELRSLAVAGTGAAADDA